MTAGLTRLTNGVSRAGCQTEAKSPTLVPAARPIGQVGVPLLDYAWYDTPVSRHAGSLRVYLDGDALENPVERNSPDKNRRSYLDFTTGRILLTINNTHKHKQKQTHNTHNKTHPEDVDHNSSTYQKMKRFVGIRLGECGGKVGMG